MLNPYFACAVILGSRLATTVTHKTVAFNTILP